LVVNLRSISCQHCRKARIFLEIRQVWMAAQILENPRSRSAKSGKRGLALTKSFICQHSTTNHFVVIWRKVHCFNDVLLGRGAITQPGLEVSEKSPGIAATWILAQLCRCKVMPFFICVGGFGKLAEPPLGIAKIQPINKISGLEYSCAPVFLHGLFVFPFVG